MPLPAWTDKHPYVKALMQQDGDLLDYGEEGESTIPPGDRSTPCVMPIEEVIYEGSAVRKYPRHAFHFRPSHKNTGRVTINGAEIFLCSSSQEAR